MRARTGILGSQGQYNGVLGQYMGSWSGLGLVWVCLGPGLYWVWVCLGLGPGLYWVWSVWSGLVCPGLVWSVWSVRVWSVWVRVRVWVWVCLGWSGSGSGASRGGLAGPEGSLRTREDDDYAGGGRKGGQDPGPSDDRAVPPAHRRDRSSPTLRDPSGWAHPS